MLSDFYKNRRVLVTGHTGFKGSWLCIWLKRLGADVCGYALEPYTERDNFVLSRLDRHVAHRVGDVRDYQRLSAVFREFRPEVVFHLAAQPLVRAGYADPKETFDVNIGGTVNLLEGCRRSDSVQSVVNVTSDKCYENREWPWGYREADVLGGRDPYSASKAASEIVSRAYRESYFGAGARGGGEAGGVATARAGNVIGGGDWREDRLIPDCIRALEGNEPVRLRNPGFHRPWQHVLEPLRGYLMLAVRLAEEPDRFSAAWNFGPAPEGTVTVEAVARMVIAHWGDGRLERRPEENAPAEARALRLEIAKAETELGWRPRWDVRRSIRATVEWYRRCPSEDGYRLCERQIGEYEESGAPEAGNGARFEGSP